MDATKILDRLSLELMLKQELDPTTCLPLATELKNACGNSGELELIAELEALLQKGGNAENYKRALAIVETLSAGSGPIGPAAEKPHTAPGADVLSYDATHSSDILDCFFAEVGCHLQELEQKLLKLESDSAHTEALNAVFGAMHSLKGIMGFLNLTCAHQLAHEAEAVMARARLRPSGIDKAECDAILRTVDALRDIKAAVLIHSKHPAQPFPALPGGFKALVLELRDMALRGKDRTASPAELLAEVKESTGALGATDGPARAPAGAAAADIRVKIEKLDRLLESIGELVIVQAQIQQDSSLRAAGSPRLIQNMGQLGKITRDLQSVAMALRMHPLRDLFGRMTRLARDLSRKQHKEVDVVVFGDETELDKNAIEALVDPLTHLIRNAIDHGVDLPAERAAAGKAPRAQLQIGARHQNGSVIISISDDGRGLDRERILARARERGLTGGIEQPDDARIQNLIFEPGFSTAEQVTELSGRGVGLDVVRRNIEALGGHVAADSVPGQSTTFSLTLPLTLAIIDGLIVRAGEERYIVPIKSVIESARPTRQQLSTVHGRGEMIELRGTLLPLIRLSDFTASRGTRSDPCDGIVMIVDCGRERCGLLVDELLGQQQAVIRSLGEQLKDIRGIASGAILGDGRVGLILDVMQILEALREARVEPVLN